jgi:hypothetical protein
MSIEQEIDRLYQLPLWDFIAERNSLTKRAGADSARVKALEKPHAAAWAVNQLYWRERRLYDAVVKAAARVRAAHGHALTGKKTDIRLAEAAKTAAVRGALDRAEALLRQAGDAASEATLTAVRETLNALPGTEGAGRLTRPLQAAVGFDTLSDLLRGAAVRPSEKADVVRFPGPSTATPDDRPHPPAERVREQAATAVKEQAARRRAVESSLTAARGALADQEQERRALDAKIQKADASIKGLNAEIEDLERELQALDRGGAKLKGP